MASLMAQMIKNLPAMQETQVQSLGQEDLLKGMATQFSILAWGEFCGQRNLVGYSPLGHTNEWLSLHFSGWRWLITSMFLTRTSCCKIIHANGYYGTWPGWVVLLGEAH